MTIKLVQKRFLKGTREFELTEDSVNIRIHPPFKEARSSSVALSILNPEPVVDGSYLQFHSRVKCGPLLSLFREKPSPEEFNAFVETLKRRALEEYSAFAGIKGGTQEGGIAANAYHEPPEFEELDDRRLASKAKSVDAAAVDGAIKMIESHLATAETKTLLTALEALKREPRNEALLLEVIAAFNGLGPQQGAVLTYAPYIGAIMSDDPFEHR